MIDVSALELMGLFEALDENEDKIDTHKETIKMLKADTKAQIKAFAESKEAKIEDINDSYKYYQKRHHKGEAANEDFFTLCALIDNATEAENEDESE